MAQESRRRRRETVAAPPVLQVVTPAAPDVNPSKIRMPRAQPSAPPPAPPVTPQAPAAAPDPPKEQVVITPRFCPHTGRPMIAIGFQMRDQANTREYTVDVPMGEAIADQIYAVADGHRDRYDPEWFETMPSQAPAG